MRKRGDQLSPTEQSVLDTLGRMFTETGAPVTASQLAQGVLPDARPPALTEILEELQPVFIRDDPGPAGPMFEPTLYGWLRSAYARIVGSIVQAALDTLRALVANRGTRPTGYSWDEIAAAASLESTAFPLAKRVLSLGELDSGGSGDLWAPARSAPLKYTFAVPHDLDEVVKYSGVDEFIEYRRRLSPELRNLLRMWRQEFDTATQFAVRTIYDEFRKTNTWPSSRQIDIRLRNRYKRSITAIAQSSRLICAGNPNDARPQSVASLTFAALYMIPEAEQDRQAIVRLLSAIGRAAQEEAGEQDVGLDQLTSVRFDDAQLQRVVKLLDVQHGAFVTRHSDDLRSIRFSTIPRMTEYAEAEQFEDVLRVNYPERLDGTDAGAFVGGYDEQDPEDVAAVGGENTPQQLARSSKPSACTIFYAWQGRLANSTNRAFILEALEAAAKALRADTALKVVPVIDRDTQGLSGAPDIGRTIFAKIQRATAFVGDVSIVHPARIDGRSPNPNVLLELGYALHALGEERVIMVMNTAYGGPERLPFDLKQKRALTYKLPPVKRGQTNLKKPAARKELVAKLTDAIRAVISLRDDEATTQ